MALAGAATVSLAAFGAAAGPVAADDRLPLTWPTVQQKASTYLIDGFEVGYLAPGLERHSMNSETFTDRTGSRTAHLAWVQGPETVHGKVSVYRTSRLGSLDEVRSSHYSHLDDGDLRSVDVNGKEAYLSEATGDVFWMERDGVAVAVFLRPDTWETQELMAMAEGISPREASVPDVPDVNLPSVDVPNVRGVAQGEETAGAVRTAADRAGQPEPAEAAEPAGVGEIPRPGGQPEPAAPAEPAGAGEAGEAQPHEPVVAAPGEAGAESGPETGESGTGTGEAGTDAPETLPAPAPGQEEGADGELSDKETAAVKRCLTEEIGAMPGAIWDQNIEFSPGSSVTWNSGLWNEVQEPIRREAISKCADRLGLEESQVEEVFKEMSTSPRPAKKSQEVSSFSQEQDLWDLLSWQ
ncbi:hypothetical protein [Actinorugispora endophytica]|nr:hypothetical protein [Actinorugispora endophytica]